MGRRQKGVGWKIRLIAALVLVAMAGALWWWWSTQHWTPEREVYPDQGMQVGAADGEVSFAVARAQGASFVYLDASFGESGRDPNFADNLVQAKAAGLQVGAVHKFDPCAVADGQSSNFVTIVPRDADMLPPAIELSSLATDCPVPVPDAAVESELMTFINQVENHLDKPAILKISANFQKHYHLAGKFERNLWLERTRLLPDYGDRPWTLWTANTALVSDVSKNPVRWVVARP